MSHPPERKKWCVWSQYSEPDLTHSRAGAVEHRRKTGRGEADAGGKSPRPRKQRALGWEGRAVRSVGDGVGMGGLPLPDPF